MATIVIVDDNASLLNYWRQLLEAQSHTLYCFTAIDVAFESIRAINPDVIILDMMFKEDDHYMPKGGFTLLTQLKLKYSGVSRIIGISGLRPSQYIPTPPLKIAAKSMGLDLALYKPVLPEILIDAVEQVLSDPGASPQKENQSKKLA